MNSAHAKYINIALAFVWIFFVYINLSAFFQRPQLSVLLFILAQSEFVVLLLIRKPAITITRRVDDYAVAIAGTFIALLFEPSVYGNASIGLYSIIQYLGDALIYVGVLIEIVAFLYLNKSAGIVPANRGVKVNGLYQYVRHPIYASYLFLYTGYVLNNPSSFNCGLLILALILQMWRIKKEEAVLLQDPIYREYSKKVRWKLLPGVL